MEHRFLNITSKIKKNRLVLRDIIKLVSEPKEQEREGEFPVGHLHGLSKKRPYPLGFFNKSRVLLFFLGFYGFFEKKIKKLYLEIQT